MVRLVRRERQLQLWAVVSKGPIFLLGQLWEQSQVSSHQARRTPCRGPLQPQHSATPLRTFRFMERHGARRFTAVRARREHTRYLLARCGFPLMCMWRPVRRPGGSVIPDANELRVTVGTLGYS